MKKTVSLFLFLFLLTAFVAIACKSRQADQQTASTPAPDQTAASAPGPISSHSVEAASNAAPSASVAGIEWTVPQNWKAQPDRPMRIVTYSIPVAQGDTEAGECAVFFFGPGQGGDVRSNINRWISQFETESKAEESSKMINDLKVTTVSIAGAYLAPGGPMMQSQGKKPNYRLLGAIVEAPDGAVFFKTTGPAATIAASEKDFTSLVNSIRKHL